MTEFAKENIQPNEAEITETIVQGTIGDQKRNYKPGTVAKRDVHVKSHGTLNATFTVLAGIPADCRVGLFATPATYPAILRLSNGAPGVGPDIIPNVRGMGLKVLLVPGKKILLGDEDVNCMDFLIANHPTSFHRHLEDYPPVRELMATGKTLQILKKFPHEGRALFGAVLKFVKNPLTLVYWSQTAYSLGADRAVKYTLVPEKKSSFFSFPNVFDRDYLRHAAEKTLRRKSVKFTLFVQPQTAGDPIEDASVEWRGPVVPVATLVIDRVDAVVTESSGEALSFNPWRVLAEHKPLGWVNRVRQAVYRADFQWRSAVNAGLDKR
jgi:hypothetical protein